METFGFSRPMDLQAPLGDILDDFLYCEVIRVLHEAAVLEAALKLHQSWMKDVCSSIKAHYHWETFECPGYDFARPLCYICRERVSPEIDMRRHAGLCDLKEIMPDYDLPCHNAHESFYPREESWV